MGIKKMTPEERLLNLIKKSSAPPDELPSMPSPLPLFSEGKPLPPPAPTRKKSYRFSSVFFFVLLCSGGLFLAFQKDLFSLRNFSSREKVQPPATQVKPEKDSMPVNRSLSPDVSAIAQKPALEKIAPPSGYTLTGVIIGEPLSAMIRNTETNENLTLELGDSLLHYTLTRIEKGKVTFEDSSKTFTLTL